MLKLLTFVCFLAAQVIITWYGHFLGKVPARGSVFGWSYSSPIAGLLVTLIAFIWIPVVINLLYGLGFQWGNRAFGSFLVVIGLWIAAAPIAALIFNSITVGEKPDVPLLIGLLLITTGSILVAAHREIALLLP
ncbi:MAG TPA: hypothetical protein DEB30_05210 [Candidatus Peribacter riflensis]|uniref:Uncharacterized protein n=1 Tax=Candidatus Peribacter riflensis TaxID=1735162 RepID=A0A0S1SMA9_9BACT|nr:MAG: hypothetical protein PeribacterA2_0985 [Candidatus Peribacter riflensis]OGJ78466.1 MAG: hypothetical protein A2398_02375 [Candidatus Peribacteria bacterium RIFOXYB1_FULL_57_12]OGJ82120.1 MAG: hypothetical protein A2412_00150 [Candidatus Peribacteria bacterium RIFOXYC1_FULL_58_8]ALM11447.1 MAG: hypothetical protein PeribacterB2_0987 [Candidatus Peribacter riflensis]ALM12549.1 MAG: hypothetical protein PeribacterC2_0986 [Candidatus Peribacter riflensis]